MSLRSSASSTPIEILVALAISRSETPRRSRASRSLLPIPPGVPCASMLGETNLALCYAKRRARRADDARELHGPARLGCAGADKEPNGGDARCAGRSHLGRPLGGHASNREHRNVGGPYNGSQPVNPQDSVAVRL